MIEPHPPRFAPALRLVKDPRTWFWAALCSAVFATSLLYWLHVAQDRSAFRAAELAASVRTARTDLAKGALRVNTRLAGDQGLMERTAGRELIEQSISQMFQALGRMQPNPARAEQVAQLRQVSARFLSVLDQQHDQPSELAAWRLAYGDLERFGEALDVEQLAQLDDVRESHQRQSMIAAGVIAGLLAVVTLGLWLAYRQEQRARELARASNEALRESEATLRALGDNLPESYVYQFEYTPDETPRFVHLSAGAERIHLLRLADMLADGNLIHMQTVPEMREQLLAVERESHRTLTDFKAEIEVVRPDGTRRWLYCRAHPRQRPNGSVIWNGVVSDITRRKQGQHALLQAKAMLEDMERVAKVGGWSYDVATGSISFTEEVSRIMEFAPGEQPSFDQVIANLPETTQAQARVDVRRALETGESFTLECDANLPSGTAKRIRIICQATLRDGRVVALHGSVQDVSELKHLQDQLLRAERLEAIGTLAGGVAHDLNNILSPVMLIVEQLKERLPQPDVRNSLDIMESSLERGAGVIGQLLTFSRGAGAGTRVRVNPRQLAAEMITLMRETFPREIVIEDRLAADLWPVMGDPTQLQQILMNLCVNARDAMPAGGRLTLIAENALLRPDVLAGHPGARPGRHVHMTVRDTGTGILRQHLGSIFDPFFTTKDVGKGTGLGLSTALGIVRSMGGFMTVDSEPGRGSAFHVCLPAADEATSDVPAPAAAAPETGGRETLLIVDDESEIRNSLRTVLEGAGYQVLEAGNGREGAGVFDTNQGRIRLVLTDLMMPEVGGVDLIRHIRHTVPTLPILVTSGFSADISGEKLAALGVKRVLQKPFRANSLLQAVRQGLDETTLASN
jgi:PAS domain S-box-containing protein